MPRLISLRASPLSIPLREPFVIATARMDATRAVLVRATVEGEGGARAEGLGEAAALWPVTREDQPELLAITTRAAGALAGRSWRAPRELDRLIDGALGSSPVARAGVECAVLDALARLARRPLARALADDLADDEAEDEAEDATRAPAPDTERAAGEGGVLHRFHTDVTLPIAAPAHMAAGALAWRARGFTAFKVKVGRAWPEDRDALRAVAAAVPDARFRLDANEGFAAREALALLDEARAAGLAIECFEQPCRRDDVAGMAEVTAHAGDVPIVADESLRSEADLDAILRARAATAVNLKLVKLGGLRAALRIGLRARREGLGVMAGAMVETRLGLCAMAHVVAALARLAPPGVDWVDLDTALLLASDPFAGGTSLEGPEGTLEDAPGLGVRILPEYEI